MAPFGRQLLDFEQLLTFDFDCSMLFQAVKHNHQF